MSVADGLPAGPQRDETAGPAQAFDLQRLSASLVFAGDRLTVADGGHLAALRRRRWSPTSMQAMQGCPSRWAVERLLPRTAGPFDSAEIGTSAHKVLEVLFGLPAAERTVQRAVRIVARLEQDQAGQVVAPTDPVDLLRWRADVMAKVSPLWRIEDPTRVLVAGREMRLDNVTVDGVPFTGIVDRTDLASSVTGAVGRRIVDYKTGKPARPGRFGDPHGDQLRLYALALRHLDGVLPVEAMIYYTGAGTQATASLNVTELDRVRARFGQTFREMNTSADTGQYRTSASGLCGWCPLATVCPAAKTAGKDIPKVPLAALGTTLGIRSAPSRVLACGAAARDADPDFPLGRHADPEDPIPVAAAPGGAGGPTSGSVTEVAPEEDRTVMTITPWPVEGKAWEEQSLDGRLNPSSYAAMGLFGATSLAIDTLEKRQQLVGPGAVLALAQTFVFVVETAQRALSGRTSVQDGLNTRLRGALHTFVDSNPPPFGQPLQVWDEWVARAVKRVETIADIVLNIWTNGAGDRPWAGYAEHLARRPANVA